MYVSSFIINYVPGRNYEPEFSYVSSHCGGNIDVFAMIVLISYNPYDLRIFV